MKLPNTFSDAFITHWSHVQWTLIVSILVRKMFLILKLTKNLVLFYLQVTDMFKTWFWGLEMDWDVILEVDLRKTVLKSEFRILLYNRRHQRGKNSSLWRQLCRCGAIRCHPDVFSAGYSLLNWSHIGIRCSSVSWQHPLTSACFTLIFMTYSLNNE